MMQTGHEQTYPRKIVGHDHANGYWWCPVCGEPYSRRHLAEDCLVGHFADDEKPSETAAI